jgi:tRNA(fMet)-specific endonuclease VapC
MKYLLDTNACIRFINGRAPRLRAKMATIARSEIAVSTISKAEMYYGSAKSQTPERSREKQLDFLETIATLPFDELAAVEYGRLRRELEIAGTPIGGNDMLIAASAIAHQLILVTHNTAEFARIPNLKLEDWE